MSTEFHYEIANWERFQHYKDRKPPWIKLHRELLNSYDWISLDEKGRLLMIVCMLIAAETDNKIPSDVDYFQQRTHMKIPPNFAPLEKLGFIKRSNVANDSKMQASACEMPQSAIVDLRSKNLEKSTSDGAMTGKIVMTFKTRKEDWFLTDAKLSQYQTTFPDVNVNAEILKAWQWIEDNSSKRKMPTGMPRFISAWLTNSGKVPWAKPVEPKPQVVTSKTIAISKEVSKKIEEGHLPFDEAEFQKQLAEQRMKSNER